VWPALTLAALVMLFGAYALVGIATLAMAQRYVRCAVRPLSGRRVSTSHHVRRTRVTRVVSHEPTLIKFPSPDYRRAAVEAHRSGQGSSRGTCLALLRCMLGASMST